MAVEEALRGRAVRCPHCQSVVQVPSADPVAPAAPAPPAQAPPDEAPEVEYLAPLAAPEEPDSIFIEPGQEDLFGRDEPPQVELPPDAEPPPGVVADDNQVIVTPPPAASTQPVVVAEEVAPRQDDLGNLMSGWAGVVTEPAGQAPVWTAASPAEPLAAPIAAPLVPAPALPAAPEPAAETLENPWANEPLLEQPFAGTAATAAVAPRAPQRVKAKLPAAVWLLSILFPYALVSTGVIVWLLWKGQERPVHPLEDLADQGLYGELGEGRVRVVDPHEALPKDFTPIRLGETRTVGDLEVTPVEVVRQKLVYHYRDGKRDETVNEEVLALRLRLKNVSKLIFHPNDATFNRAYRKNAPIYTYLEAAGKQFYGAVGDPHQERVQGQRFDALLPGETLETVVVAAKEAPPGEQGAAAFVQALPPGERLLWRVQLRKGRGEVTLKQGGRRSVWLTTVVPITFTPADIKSAPPPEP
jgi:hypothetical protein